MIMELAYCKLYVQYPNRARLWPRSGYCLASGVLNFSRVSVQLVHYLTALSVLAGSLVIAGTGQSPAPFRVSST